MEDPNQKMIALKKAYADIILNTVKEAAARVMVSERKARCLQQELCSVKDEALRMLLRLNNIVDSKMHEAEIASLCQRRKAEELEAQLHEAEDVITGLRIQLKKAQYQLEKERKDKLQRLEGKVMNKTTFSSGSTLEPDSSSPSSELQTVSSYFRSKKMEKMAHATYDSELKSIEQFPVHSDDSDSPSTAAGTKDHRPYRKRCSQIIRAQQTKFLDYSLPLGIDVKGSQVLEEKEPSVKKSDKKERGFSEKSLHGAVLKRSVKLHSLRNTTQFGKCTTGSCRLYGSQLTKPHHPSCIISLCRPYLKDGNARSDKNEHPPMPEHKIDSYKDASGNSNTGKLKGNMNGGNLNGHSPDQLIDPCGKSFVLSPCRTSISLANDNEKSGDHSKTKRQTKMKKLTCLDPGLSSTGNYFDCTSGPTSVATSVKVDKSRVLENAANSQKELTALSVKQESNEIRNLIFPGSELNSKMSPDTKCKQICGVKNCSPGRVDKKIFLKCIRQSKHKRKAMGISDENIYPDKSNGKRRLIEKLNFEPEFERSDLIKDSTSESRQLSQVARQLVSLSRKRW